MSTLIGHDAETKSVSRQLGTSVLLLPFTDKETEPDNVPLLTYPVQ